VQRAARASGGDLSGGAAGCIERRVAQNRHIAVELAVTLGDALDISLGQRDRRKGALGNCAARLGDG